MKRSIYLVLIVSGFCYGQRNEFKTYPNGLIYDETTMHKLGNIVDSLNVKFRTCDLSHPYYSLSQGRGTFVDIPSKAARKLIQEGISLEEFTTKFPGSVVNKNVWVVKRRYSDYRGQKKIEYSGLPGMSREPSITVKDKTDNNRNTGWIVSGDDTEAVHLEKLEALELPSEYARLVQYVDCMIDTTAKIYFPEAEGRVYQKVDEGSKANQFIKWAAKFPDEPKFPDYEKKNFDSVYPAYLKKHTGWDSLRLLALDDQMRTAPYRRSMLMDALDEAIVSGNSDDRLEFYVSRYLSREEALKLKRSRKVIGNCSMDQSPRYHAMNICQLAAETTQWDIFLRSHLDIMNDRFERMSDGSYAWAGRKTYLKELEELDIQAIDLLLGTSLRVENVNDNHYRGSIGRVGRGLADATDKDKLEAQLMKMMQDDKLDPYNRLLLAYLFDHYAHNLEDESRKSLAQGKLKEAVNMMPSFVKEAWGKK